MAEEVAVPVEGIVSYPDQLPEGPVADATMPESRPASSEIVGPSADDEVGEPAPKRPRMTVLRVGDETLCHMDLHDEASGEQHAQYDDFWMDDFHDDMVEDSPPMSTGVWQPYSEAQPEIYGEQLSAIDIEADEIEIDRLLQMGVITTVDKYSGALDAPLSAKMVRTWRKKQREEKGDDGQVVSTTAWLRRSRLVGRDFNFLEYGEDVYSPASSSAVVKLLPAMAVTNAMMVDGAIATLDVSDAFLQVPQPTPRKVSLDGTEYVILKCLPGQRDASKLWYAFFIERLRAHMEISICPVQPCILHHSMFVQWP